MRKSFFRYDYNLKITLINLILCVIFLIIGLCLLDKTIAFIILVCIGLVFGLNSIFIYNHGIHINYKRKKIYLFDDLLLRKLDFQNIRYLSYEIINKKTNSNFKGFCTEFFHPDTYMTHSDYVYNEGIVLELCFHLIDGTTLKSYYGWMYREKKKENIKKQIYNIERLIESFKEKKD